MALTSQDTSIRRRPLIGSFGAGFALSLVLVLAILAAALWRFAPAMGEMVASARPQPPNFAVLTELSPVIKVHLYTALAALALGAVLMAARKGRRFHRVAGWAWVVLVAITAVSTLFITGLSPGRWSWIHLFTGWTLIVLPLGVIWARRHAVQHHRRAMMGLFYGAFAVNLLFTFIPGRTMWSVFFG